jgi:hypothetical protein
VTGGKPIAVLLQSISGVSGINPLVTFYVIHGGKSSLFPLCYSFIFSRRPHKTVCLSLCMLNKDLILKTTQQILMPFFLLDRVIQGEGLHAYNMYDIIKKHFSISIAL